MRSLSLLVFVLCVTPVSAQRMDLGQCPCGPDWIVGADRALIPQGWAGADFRPACARHDACLNSGCNRQWCDSQFQTELMNSCRYSSQPDQCRRVTALMSRVTRSYSGRSLSSCQRRWAIARLRRVNARFGRNPYPGR
ncbi:MAG: hypothetical protein AB8G99_06415 [Planctomycetaceae bacterium]